MRVVVFAALIAHTQMIVRQTAPISFREECQPISNGLSQNGHPIAAGLLQEGGGRDSGRKCRRPGQEIDTTTRSEEIWKLFGKPNCVRIVAAVVIAQIENDGTGFGRTQDCSRRRNKRRY